jgi:tetratricopeptide (TPR) repeat protein
VLLKPEIPSLVPRLLPGTDLRGLPLSPAEAFIVSRVDGAISVAELSEQTGKALAEVSALLERLAELGAITLHAPQPAERRASRAPAPNPSVSLRVGPIVEKNAVSEAKHPAASLYDPAELDEAVDIDLPRRRQILDLFHHLDELDHYQLFGIEPSADKKAIKAAYFEVVNVFHPDRYFGKNVGSFKPKLEKVFARLTESYNVLSRGQSRAEYDTYLRAQSKTRAFDAGQTESAAHQAALQEVMQRIQAEASAAARGTGVAPPPPPPPSSRAHQSLRPDPPLESQPAPRPSASMRPTDPEERRRALARKLGRPVPSPSPERDAARQVDAEVETQRAAEEDGLRKTWVAEELKRRYQERMHLARDRQVEAYTRAATQALAKGDTVGAANALRIAASLSPGDPTLTQRLSEVSGKARVDLSSSYLEQAEYEERAENWLAASKSYARVVAGRPEAAFYDKLAHCLLSGDGDLREAGEAAKKAVLARPDSASYRVTLARFYVKAGMRQSAEGELTRAATLAPSDDKVTDWVRRLKRELG